MARIKGLLFLWCFVLLGAARDEPVFISLGDETELTWPEAVRLNVSRRGIVEVTGGENGAWRLAGIGTGSVVLTGYSALGETMGRRLVRVRIEPLPEGREASFPCDVIEGVRCDPLRRRMSGQTANLAWWRAQRKDCEGASACSFDVTLTEGARRHWERQLKQKLAPWFHPRVDDEGHILALTSCEGKEEVAWQELAERLSGEPERFVTVRCRAALAPEEFVARAKVLFVRRDQAEQLGLKWHQPLERVTPQFFSSLLKMRESVLGEPVVRFMGGEKATVHTGGENLYRDREGGEHWQALGLNLELFVPHWEKEGARLDVMMTLRQPESRDQLKAAGLKSRVRLSYGKPALVGRLDLAAKSESGEALAFLAGIPILGPLAKFGGTSQVESRLYLVMTLDRAANVDLVVPETE